MFNPTPEQSAVFDAIADGTSNLLVEACAGSGKTTTIVEGLQCIRRAPHDLLPPSILFLAFNKNIAETLKARCPVGVNCSTFHSLGLRALKNSGIVERNVKIDARKCSKLVWNAMDRNDPDVRNVIQLVSFAKSCWPEKIEQGFWQDIIRQHDISFENQFRAKQVAMKVFEASCRDVETLDFDDMLYLPVLLNASFDPQDWIFVDEVQDTNDIQLEILERLRKPSPFRYIDEIPRPNDLEILKSAVSPTRLVFVGDRQQAIYGFRGANADSMDRIAKRFSTKSYPLSVSWRCSKAVVEEARKGLTT